MSLDTIYICCDDGNCYETEFIQGDNWAISLEEFQDSELWIRVPVVNGKLQRALHAEQLIADIGLPIESVKKFGVRGFQKKTWEIFKITKWKPDAAFPRRLLPADWQPKLAKNLGTGTYCCCTKSHRRTREAARA